MIQPVLGPNNPTALRMTHVSLAIRSWLRGKGLLWVINWLRWAPFRRRLRCYRREYLRTKPDCLQIGLESCLANFKVLSADHYVSLRSGGENAVLRCLLRQVRTGDTVWDVGANAGYYTVILAKAVGPAGRVVAFEPHPGALELLQQNVTLNGLANVVLVPFALGRTRATLKMEVPEHPLAGSSRLLLDEHLDVAATGVIEVAVRPGDELCELERLPEPNLVKVDVEGAEEEVLAGLSRVLNSRRCRGVLCEVHFSIFESRGDRDAVLRIQTCLRDSGFGKMAWLDYSHLFARKPQ